MAQKKDHGLTSRQIKILEAAQQAGLHRNIEKVCQEADIPVRTFYRWLAQDPQFKERWDRLWYNSARRHLPGAVQALAHEAHSGNVKAIKLLSELAGVYTSKVDLAAKIGGEIKVVFNIPRPGSPGSKDRGHEEQGNEDQNKHD